MQVWRICRGKHAAGSFSGEGARLFSGRWNPAGVRMVYCSSSLSLAALEFFVHLEPSVAPEDLVSISAEIPDELAMGRVATASLPSDWRQLDHPAVRAIGAEWAASLRSAALIVPSAVIDGEWNVLLNPAHPDFEKVVIGKPGPFLFDARMFQR